MAKPKTYNELAGLNDDSVSLVDTFNQMGEITVGGGTMGTGRGILAGNSTTVTKPGTTVTRSAGGSSGTGSEPVSSESTSTTSVDLSGSYTTGTKSQTQEFAMSPYGDLELTKYLYESGLQNIFSDYQKNIQTLQQNEAQQLQQAYAIREMSKKYLGEYASNVGVGDVSGNLLDIYSQYASNIGDIQQNFAALEMNLTREYTTERMNTFNELLKTQYEIDVAELDNAAYEASQYAFTNFSNDVAGGLAYLESQKDNMRPQDFDAVKQSYYQSNAQAVIDNISSGNPYFGFADLETQTLKNQEQYLEEVQKWLSPEDFTRVQEIIALKELYSDGGSEIGFDPVAGLDASIFSSDPNITSESDIYEVEGNRFAVSMATVLDDAVAIDNNVSPDLLNEKFEEATGQDRGDIPENHIVQYQGFYIFRNGNWYRMHDIGGSGTSFDKFNQQNYATWSKDHQGPRAGGIQIDFDSEYGDGLDAVTYQGKTYVEDGSVGEYSKLLDSADFDMQGLITYLNNKFMTRAMGEKPSSTEVAYYVPKGQVFFYNGQFFVYTEDGQKIRPMKLQTESE